MILLKDGDGCRHVMVDAFQAFYFVCWSDWVATKVRRRKLLSQALARLHHQAVSKAWAQWRNAVRVSKKAAVACHTMRQWCVSDHMDDHVCMWSGGKPTL